MSVAVPDLRLPGRSRAWKWWVCGLLLLATMVNYMDRLTLNLLAPRIQDEMHLSDIEYGHVEFGFAVAFAFGAILVGWIADRVGVYWAYPATLLVWSVAGFATGFTTGFVWLFACRFLLGFAESGHWPCALRTTQQVLPPEQRTLGNSILQSGAAFGSVLIPLVVYWTVDPRVVGSWRGPFLVVGACGAAWAVAWVVSIRRRDVAIQPGMKNEEQGTGNLKLIRVLFSVALALLTILVSLSSRRVRVVLLSYGRSQAVRRFCALVILVVTINATWHFFRVWLSPLLRDLGYDEAQRNLFTTFYYLAAGLGSLSAGMLTLLLARRGMSVHFSRLAVFLVYGLLTALALWAAFLPAGPLLLGVLLAVAFGSLGVFPAYYSFSQELTAKHLGKLTGFLGCACWLALAGWQELIAHVKTWTHSLTICMLVAAVLPLVGFAALVGLWGRDEPKTADLDAAPSFDGSSVEPVAGIQLGADVDGIRAGEVRGVTR